MLAVSANSPRRTRSDLARLTITGTAPPIPSALSAVSTEYASSTSLEAPAFQRPIFLPELTALWTLHMWYQNARQAVPLLQPDALALK